MKLWIIHNASAKIKKMKDIIVALHEELKKKGCEVEVLMNDEIIMYYDNKNFPRIKTEKNLELPNGIIFWDKDTMLARHLEMMGIKLFNSASAIESCDDKALTYLKLSNLKIMVPKTIVSPFLYGGCSLSEKYLKKIKMELGYPMIIKEVRGSFGMQVFKINNDEDLKKQINNVGIKKVIFQEYIECSCGKDVRVNIVGDRIIGAMLRKNPNDFRANITLGATAQKIDLTQEQEKIALYVHKELGLDFSGVDLLFSKEGEPILCEVNSNPNFLSFERVTGLDYCSELIAYVMRRLNENYRCNFL